MRCIMSCTDAVHRGEGARRTYHNDIITCMHILCGPRCEEIFGRRRATRTRPHIIYADALKTWCTRPHSLWYSCAERGERGVGGGEWK